MSAWTAGWTYRASLVLLLERSLGAGGEETRVKSSLLDFTDLPRKCPRTRVCFGLRLLVTKAAVRTCQCTSNIVIGRDGHERS